MTDFSVKSDAQIDQWIKNHEAKKAFDAPLYRRLLEERARRTQERTSLNIAISLNILRTAAIQQVCTTYGDLAKGSGVDWSQARHKMNGPGGHLDRLLDVCFARGLPVLPALCVNKAGVEKGELEETALSGFVEGARRLGIIVTDAAAFHHACRDECWLGGKSEAANRSI